MCRDRIEAVLGELLNELKFDRMIQGGAEGVDHVARRWASRIGVEIVTVEADWQEHGKAAGPIRNQEMMDMSPGIVAAFPLVSPHGSTGIHESSPGTYDCLCRALRSGIGVRVTPVSVPRRA